MSVSVANFSPTLTNPFNSSVYTGLSGSNPGNYYYNSGELYVFQQVGNNTSVTGTVTIPYSSTIHYYLIGGGGNGSDGSSSIAGNGGSGGGYYTNSITVPANTPISLTVGGSNSNTVFGSQSASSGSNGSNAGIGVNGNIFTDLLSNQYYYGSAGGAGGNSIHTDGYTGGHINVLGSVGGTGGSIGHLNGDNGNVGCGAGGGANAFSFAYGDGVIGGFNGGGGGGGGAGDVGTVGNTGGNQSHSYGGNGGVGLIVLIIIPSPPCFKADTKLLTLNGYVQVQDLRKGDLIKTLQNGYKPIEMIGKRNIFHYASPQRIKDQLYKCTPANYPELFEDLVITGCHAILVDNFKDEQEKEKVFNLYKDIYVTEGKYRLPACLDDRSSVYEISDNFTIYHLALENDNYYSNYGIYANGLIVETCSKRYLREIANVQLIE
jgi:hypothetical protein